MDDNRTVTGMGPQLGAQLALNPAGSASNDLEDQGSAGGYRRPETGSFVNPTRRRQRELGTALPLPESDAYLAAVIQMQVHGELPDTVAGALALKQQHVQHYVDNYLMRPGAASALPDWPQELVAPGTEPAFSPIPNDPENSQDNPSGEITSTAPAEVSDSSAQSEAVDEPEESSDSARFRPGI